MTIHVPFDNTYARLPERFFARLAPTPVAAPRLVKLNEVLARDLGLDPRELASPEGIAVLAGVRVPSGAEPLAAAYAGHQFGGFSPRLGDGRAILLGEVLDRAGQRRDIQLKGSGPTPFSRAGDGRAAIGPVLREYLVSEAMHALGLRTTRALAAVATGEPVLRETALPGAVLTRVASSHIRVGTFQYFAARGDLEGLRALRDHAIARHYPAAAEARSPSLALLEGVVAAQADLVASWLLVGFVHGVMNTDNTSISGETIDYGPCAFLDAYDPATVFSSIDVHGRYAYGHQPAIAHWNLSRLAETLIVLIGEELTGRPAGDEEDKEADAAALEAARTALAAFAPHFEGAYHAGLRAKLGLATAREDDIPLAGDLLKLMAANGADFTLTFRGLARGAADPTAPIPSCDLFIDRPAFDAWAGRWRERLAAEPGDPATRAAAMRRTNPAFIPRNHRVEAALRAAEREDYAPFERLLAIIVRPYDEQPGAEEFELPAEAHERVTRTFCGT